jgi:hypothetical protein
MRNVSDFSSSSVAHLSSDMKASPLTMKSTGAKAPDWDKHYGKAFKFVKTPSGARRTVNGQSMDDEEGTVSMVTPLNNDAWSKWEEADEGTKSKCKKDWDNTWNNTGGYKQRQVLHNIMPDMKGK